MVIIIIVLKPHPLSMHGNQYFYQLEAVSLSTTPQKATFSNTLFPVSSVSDFVFFSMFDLPLRSCYLPSCSYTKLGQRCYVVKEEGQIPFMKLHYLLLSIYFNQASALQIWSLVKLKMQLNLDILGEGRVTSMQYFSGVMNFI